MNKRWLDLLLTASLVCLCAQISRSSLAATPPQSTFAAKVLRAVPREDVQTSAGFSTTTAPAPSGKKWWVVEVEFTLTQKDAILPIKGIKLSAEGSKAFRAVGLAPPFKEEFGFFDRLAAGPGQAGQMYTLKDGDLFAFLRKGGGQVWIQAKNPVQINFLFEVPAAIQPSAIELGESVQLTLR